MAYRELEYGGLVGFDAPNIIKTFTSAEITTSGNYEYLTNNYVATQDCYLCGFLTYKAGMTTVGAQIKVDNVIVALLYNKLTSTPTYSEELDEGICIPIKKGQSVSIRSASNTIATNIKVYGTK